jgi:hypothetical protein
MTCFLYRLKIVFDVMDQSVGSCHELEPSSLEVDGSGCYSRPLEITLISAIIGDARFLGLARLELFLEINTKF